MFIDTHAHITFPEFESDLPAVIQRAKQANLEAIINIALDDKSIERSLKLSEQYPNYIYTAVGVHPHEAKDWSQKDAEKIRKLAQEKKIIAVGEMGLDYYYEHSSKEQQKKAFRESLRLAQELNLPAIIHIRDAAKEAMMIIHEENQGNLKGVLHCFGGDMNLAKEALDIGLLISFTGIATFPKATNVKEAVKQIPLDSIMIETDCPFLAPVPYRGQRNEPAYVVRVAETIAEIKGLTTEEAALQTTKTAKEFFQM